ncbi:GntR family transcriptional regulator [Arthrobacter sp. ISL-30]|uniref:GntR family transcriptional regulator n=1 Tax=Arthrobacter sp. ISL-30 TaxID=2819109 RepID=UPI001BE730BF|nr:GntR family transcriptional regulator [Arthrobacter sp. ISL-30]MBT2513408.1 GntR family transcriptional regulator [Arthrobacter sp. ISL-30]
MHRDAARFLSQPVVAQPGSPLGVAVYSRIPEAIRNGLLTPGSMIPTETEFGTDMKVIRTVVREALMLLEEDGLIRARRGVGRFVSDMLPRIGIERIRPFEEVLGSTGQQVHPHVASMLMDEDTLVAHCDSSSSEPSPSRQVLTRLTRAENALYEELGNGTYGEKIRLE